MTRWKASSIHLLLSILALSAIAAVLVWRWYPPGLFHTARADRLLLVIAGVDVVMGPLLTLIVFKQGKPGLKFDLAAIALLQVAAMTYGLHTVWQSRPVYLVSLADRLRLVFASDLDPKDLREAPADYRQLPWLTVETIAARVPQDSRERQDLLFATLQTGKDIDLLPRYYAPFDSASAHRLRDKSPTAPEFSAELTGDAAQTFAAGVRSTGRESTQLRVAPIRSSRGDAIMLLDAGSGQPLKPVAIDPLPALSALEHKRAARQGTLQSK